MTIDEAIAHCRENNCAGECKAEHEQLAKWLEKLRDRAWHYPAKGDLPETDERVLCCTQTKSGQMNIVLGYYMDGMWRCGMNSNVVAWQPLPEPPEAEK